jgi:hypothetical protein
MKKRRLFLGAALLGALSLAAMGEAGAQLGGSGGGMGRRGGGGGSPRDSGGERSEATRLSANDQIRMQLTNTRLALKLSSEQNPAWQSYEDKVIGLISEQPQSPGDGAVKQIDRNAELLRGRLAAMQDLAYAAKDLYAILSDDQKAVAERMLGATVPPAYAGPRSASFRGG